MEVEELVAKLEANMSPTSMREFAATILRLADSIDQNWKPERVRSNYPMFSKAEHIERNALSISFSATKEEYRSKLREEAVGSDLVGNPAWNILLELFKQFAGGAKVSTKSLQVISGSSETTTLRIIDRLAERGLVVRSASEADKRVTFISLTRDGVTKVGSVLERLGD